jgi:RecA/RadA recombinase
MATSKSKKASVEKTKAPKPDKAPKKPKFDIAAHYSDSLDTIEKRQGYVASSLDAAPPISSGMLAVDIMLGGGIRPCMITGVAQEQGGKTTLALTVMAAAIKQNVPIIAFADFEGSTKNSKPYVHSILKGAGVNLSMDEVFGKKGKDGGWITPPRVRYRSETILERFYDWLSEILRDLPDKKYVEGKWWLVFEDDKKNKSKISEFVDAGMTRKYGNGLWVEAPDGNMQGIMFVDSYTAMQPKIKDEEEIGNQLSVKAAAFSKQLERVKGRMADKMVTVYGLNHLRDNPMAMFGPKESEKGGKALQQFSDVRIKHTSRALSAAPFSPKPDKNYDYNESETSVEFKGRDVYRYVVLKSIKNKLWTPQRSVVIRIWVEDGSGTARGLDPVFDTIYFLHITGQLKGNRKKFTLNINGLGAAKKPVTWEDLKKWVLGNKEEMTKISTSLGYKPMSLRALCFKQIKDGTAEELYLEQRNSKVKGDDESENDDE